MWEKEGGQMFSNDSKYSGSVQEIKPQDISSVMFAKLI